MRTSSLSCVLILVAAVGLGVLSSVVTASLVSPVAPQLPSATVDTSLEMQLEALVERLEHALAQLGEMQRMMEMQRSIQREPVEKAAGEESNVGAELEQILALLQQRSEGWPVFSAAQPVPRGVPQDWTLLSRLHWLSERDPQAAADSVALMTPPELVAQYGQPSKVSRENEELRLTYYQNNDAGEVVGHVAFALEDGYVVRFESALTR